MSDKPDTNAAGLPDPAPAPDDFAELDRLRESYRSNLPDPSSSPMMGDPEPTEDDVIQGAREKEYAKPTPGVFGASEGWIHVPKEQRIQTYKRIILGSVGIFALAAVVFFADSFLSSVRVPDLIGLSTSQAVTRITDAGLTVAEVIEANVPGVDPGIVVNQRPSVDERVRRGDAVTLTVSSATADASVPSVIGQRAGDAEITIASSRLSVQMVTVYSDTDEVGVVVGQLPISGTVVSAGSTVAVMVSGGPLSLEREIPRAIGLTEDAALLLIQSRGFRAVAYTGATDLGSVGQVVTQTPGSSAELTPGAVVQLLVARGETADEIDVPDVTGKSQKDAAAELEALGIGVDIIKVVDEGTQKGAVAAQMPVAGTATVTKGERVGLLVSTGSESRAIVPNLEGRSLADALNLVRDFGFVPVVVTWAGGLEPASTTPVAQQYPAAASSYRVGLPVVVFAPRPSTTP